MKTCRACGQPKPPEAFTRDRRKPDGRSVRCKSCHNEMTSAWRAENPDYLRDYYLAHRESKPPPHTVVINGSKACTQCGVSKPLDDFHRQRRGTGKRVEVCKACLQRRHRDNPEPGRARARRARETNPEYMRLWRANNRDRIAEHDLHRRLRLTGQTYGHTTEYMAGVGAELRAQPCTYCAGIGGEVDHIVPLARGGPHHPQNLAPACRACNSSKGNRLLHEWDGPPALRLVA